MKQLSTLVAAIATFCCSTLLQAQTLDDLVNLDALLACECELVLEPVCVDLGVGVTFPAPNACVAECLSLPIVEGGDCMTPEALSFWLAYFGVNPEDFGDFEDIEELLEDLLDDYLDEDDDHHHHGNGHHHDDDNDEDVEDDDDDEDDDHHGGHHGDHHGDWDGHCHGDSLGVDTLDGDGVVTVSDVLDVLSEFGCVEGCVMDLNGDGSTNVTDVLAVLSAFGTAC